MRYYLPTIPSLHALAPRMMPYEAPAVACTDIGSVWSFSMAPKIFLSRSQTSHATAKPHASSISRSIARAARLSQNYYFYLTAAAEQCPTERAPTTSLVVLDLLALAPLTFCANTQQMPRERNSLGVNCVVVSLSKRLLRCRGL
jgi:hypothetical protein